MTSWAHSKLVVLGANGMLAKALIPQLRQRTDEQGGEVLAWTRSDLDITCRERVIEKIMDASPAVVINCAAYTDVDGCETNVDHAMAVNTEGPRHIAEACKANDAFFIHYSTDFIFDGLSSRPYSTSDVPHPLSAYGRSKFFGARAVCMSGCRHLVIRTSWLYGFGGRNFVDAILMKAGKGEPLKVVTDQIGRPTYAKDLSEATANLLDAAAKGVFHFANDGQCSWHEFAEEIIRQSGLNVPVGRISSTDLNRPAKRPAYSVLDLSGYEAATGKMPRHWKPALADYLEHRRIEGKAA